MSMSNEKDVLAVNQAFYRAFAKNDLKTMTDLWSNGTGSLCIQPGKDAIQGWEKIQTSWATLFKCGHRVEIETDVITTEVNGDFAYVVLIENWTQVNRVNRLQAQSMGTNIFERLGQKWYLVHHHSSPIMQPERSPTRRLLPSLRFWE